MATIVRPAERLITLSLSGELTEDDCRVFRTVVERLAPSVRVPALVDASDLSPEGLTGELIRNCAKRMMRTRVRVAVVAPADIVFGMARMLSLLLASDEMEVFRGVDAAHEWLASGRVD